MPRHRVRREHRDFARTQRRDMSNAERELWDALRDGRLNGLKFRRQAPIGPYVADFLCLAARVIVETDGPLHETDEARRHDARRDAWLRTQGFVVLRLPNDLVLGAPDIAVKRIEETIAEVERRKR